MWAKSMVQTRIAAWVFGRLKIVWWCLVKLPGKGISPVLSNHNVVQVPITNSQKVGGNAVPHQAAHLVQLSSVNPILFHMPFLQGNLFRGFYMTMGTSSPVKVWFHIISQQLLLFKRKMHLAFGCIWHMNDLTMTSFTTHLHGTGVFLITACSDVPRS